MTVVKIALFTCSSFCSVFRMGARFMNVTGSFLRVNVHDDADDDEYTPNISIKDRTKIRNDERWS